LHPPNVSNINTWNEKENPPEPIIFAEKVGPISAEEDA
jgi:hypothetical protein